MLRNRVWLALLLVSVFVAGFFVGQVRPRTVRADAVSSIPFAFGQCRGAMGTDLLVFEDNQGTVRLVHPASGKVFGTVSRR